MYTLPPGTPGTSTRGKFGTEYALPAYNGIAKIVNMPCLPSPRIWTETLTPSLIRLIKTNAQPVWKQEIKWATGRSWLKHLKNRAVAVEEEAGPLMADLHMALWDVAEVADKSMFYLWVGGMVGELIADWSSLAHAYTHCDASGGTGVGQGLSCVGFWPMNVGWGEGPAYVSNFPTGPHLVPPELVVPASKLGSLFFGMQVGAANTASFTGSAQIINTRTGQVFDSSAISLSPGDSPRWLMVGSTGLPGSAHGERYMGQVRFDITQGIMLGVFAENGHMGAHLNTTVSYKHLPRTPRGPNIITPSYRRHHRKHSHRTKA